MDADQKIVTGGIAVVIAMAVVYLLSAIFLPARPAGRGEGSDGAFSKKTWYSPDSTWTECIQSNGPAENLDRLGALDNPQARDYKKSDGSLYKVIVSRDIDRGREAVSYYYLSQSDCIAEQLEVGKNLADKYR